MSTNPEVKDDLKEKHEHHHKEHHHKVKITINGKEYETHPGVNTVEHLRHLGKVPADEILSEFKNGQLIDLDDKGHVEIHGGEVFASHIKSCGSS